jgi:glycosyltransferase involved in cell wall biosynthesis
VTARPDPPAGVTVIGHVPYARHAALGLHRAGLLERFLTTPQFARTPPRLLAPGVLAATVATRVDPALAGVPVHRLWAGLATTAALRRAVRDDEGTHRWRQVLWDLDARLHRPAGDTVHLAQWPFAETALAARRRGSVVVLEPHAPHPVHRLATTAPLLRRHGVRCRFADQRVLDRIERTLAVADLIVCSSEVTRSSYLAVGFPEERLVTVHLGCDPDVFTPATEPPQRCRFLFAGREPVGKGFFDLAVAARALAATSELVCTGPARAELVAATAGVRARVTFLGGVPAHRFPAVLREATALVLPSLSENFGLVVLEAMAAGLPVVVSDRVGAADLVDDGVNGLVVPAGDPDALAEAMRRLEVDPDLRARLGAAARATAETNTWVDYGDRLAAVYRAHALVRRQ